MIPERVLVVKTDPTVRYSRKRGGFGGQTVRIDEIPRFPVNVTHELPDGTKCHIEMRLCATFLWCDESGEPL